MFITSIVLRWVGLVMTRYVQEPTARHTWDVVQELVSEMLDRLEIKVLQSEPKMSQTSLQPYQSQVFTDETAEQGTTAVRETHQRVPAPKRLRKPRARESQPS